ncbi:MAG: DUF3817 domain-containing protein [Phycisphaerales bacterium]|nr:DUF3817 domain-containing protein [Phycisphaerales bacterium]
MTAIDTLIKLTDSAGGRFRLAAIAEAWSWAGLLAGMCFKYLIVLDPIGVQIMGPIHGILFITYLIATFQAAKEYRWSSRARFLALLAAIPPFTTWLFERVAMKRGMLGVVSSGAESGALAGRRR